MKIARRVYTTEISRKEGEESHEPNVKNVPAWLARDGFVGGFCEGRMVSGGGCGTGHRAERRDDHRRYGKSADAVRSDRDRGREDQGRRKQKHGLSCRCQSHRCRGKVHCPRSDRNAREHTTTVR